MLNNNELYYVWHDLLSWECQIIDIIYNNSKTPISIYFKDKDNIIMGLVTLNDKNKFLVRAELRENFDKWSNCIYEQEYDWNHFYSNCYNPNTLYKELLLSYFYLYKNLE